jgi:hypothetical protein
MQRSNVGNKTGINCTALKLRSALTDSPSDIRWAAAQNIVIGVTRNI